MDEEFPGSPIDRLEALVDPGSLVVEDKADSVVWGRGLVDGAPLVAFATDPAVQGGSLGAEACLAIADAVVRATADGVPVIGLWHSGGARLQEGIAALDAMGRVFRAKTAASGRVPQVSVVLGPAAGGAAYGPALSDVVVTSPDARTFVTGPAVVAQVTGESLTAADLGSPEVHGRHSGLVHVAAASPVEAIRTARVLASLLRGQERQVDRVLPDARFDEVLPQRVRRAYDVSALVRLLLDDDGDAVQLHPQWAANVSTWLGRLGGRPVGVVANNPLRLGGCLDARAADKAARFVRLCDGLGLPLVVVVDVPGYLPGRTQELDGIVRRGAKLLHAFSEATVPRVTLLTRKAFGGAYIAMNSRSLGADAVFAWPGAVVDVMGPEAAVEVVHRKHLAALEPAERVAETARLVAERPPSDGTARALELGLVDEVVLPRDTRTALVAALAAVPRRRGRHGNIPL